jgi:non-ribosomal peptide synthetase component F
VNTLVQGAWALLLHRYTGLRTVAFGATVSGRPPDLPGADRLLGLFINTLPMIVTLAPEREKISWLRDLQERNISLREHDQTPLYEIQRWAGRSGEGLFDSILVFENYPMDEALQQAAPGGLVFSDLGGRETTNYPMTVSILQSDTLRLHYSYLCTHFSEAAVESIAEQVTRLLTDIAQGANRPLCEIDLLSEGERAQITAWGVNEQRYGSTEPVHCLIERQVQARPEALALIFGAGLDCVELSYAELNRRANRLAHRLIAFGVMPEV